MARGGKLLREPTQYGAATMKLNKREFDTKTTSKHVHRTRKNSIVDLIPEHNLTTVRPGALTKAAKEKSSLALASLFVPPVKAAPAAEYVASSADERFHLFEDLLCCALFPLDSRDSKGPYPSVLLKDKAKLIKEAIFGSSKVDESRLDQAFETSLIACSNGVWKDFSTRKSMLDGQSIAHYSAAAFSDPNVHKAWRTHQDAEIDRLTTKLKSEKQGDDELTVTVIEGRNLAPCDKSGSSDPYVMARVSRFDPAHKTRKLSAKTSVINHNRNPVWQEDLVFHLPHHDDASSIPADAKIKFNVWDRDEAIDDFEGFAEIPLAPLYKSPYAPLSFTLPLLPRSASKGLVGKLLNNIGHSKKQKDLGSISVEVTLRRRSVPHFPSSLPSPSPAVDRYARVRSLVSLLLKDPDTFCISKPIDWLLGEYCGRYGVGRLHARLCIMENVLAKFQTKTKFFEGLKIAANDLQTEVYGQDSFPTKNEADWVRRLLDTATATTEQYIIKYPLAFPHDDSGVITVDPDDAHPLGAAIDAFASCLPFVNVVHQPGVADANTVILNSKLDEFIRKFTSFSFARWYEEFTQSGAEVVALDVVALLSTIQMVLSQLDEDRDVYAQEFPKTFDLVRRTTREYYSLIVEKVHEIFRNDPPLAAETFILCSLMANFHSLHGHHLKKSSDGEQDDIEPIDLGAVFGPYVGLWVQQAGTRIKDWTSKAIALDTFEALHVPDLSEGDLSTGKEVAFLHSSSVVDLFSAFDQAKAFLEGLVFDVTEYVIPFALMVGKITEFYVGKLKTVSREDILHQAGVITEAEKHLTELFNSSTSPRSPRIRDSIEITASAKFCVRLNCMSTAAELLSSFIDELQPMAPRSTGTENALEDALQDTFTKLRYHTAEMIDVVTGRMTSPIGAAIAIALKNPPLRATVYSEEDLDKRLAPLEEYLNAELEVFSNNLYFVMCQKVLRSIWSAVIATFEHTLLPENFHQNATPAALEMVAHSARLSRALIEDNLVPFFHGGGEGLSEILINKNLALLNSALPLFDMPTGTLIDTYRSLEHETSSGKSSNPLRPIHVLAIISTRTKVDEKAKEFVIAKDAQAKNRELGVKFGLESSKEMLVGKYSCKGVGCLSLDLYLTTYHLCWRPSHATKMTKSRKTKVLPYTAIINLQKTKNKFLGLSTDDGLCVTESTLDDYVLTGLTKRDQVFGEILQQAKQCGNSRLLTAIGESSGQMTSSNATALINQAKEDKKRKVFAAMFGVPEAEQVVQKYIASWNAWSSGKLFVTSRHVCFKPKRLGAILGKKEKLDIADIKTIEKKTTAFILNNSILITTKDAKKIEIGGLSRRDETYCLLIDLKESLSRSSK